MRKRTSVADTTPIRVVVVTLDAHLASGFERAARSLRKRLPGLELGFHVAAEWAGAPDAVERCRRDIECGDIVILHMLFMEDHIQAVLPALERRAPDCDAMVGCMSAREIVQLTRMGRFRIQGDDSSLLSRLKSLRRRKEDASRPSTPGARQASMLRRIPQLLRFVPGAAQDLRAYLLTMQYWLAGSEENVENMIAFLVSRYASGPRAALRRRVDPALPVEYPANGLYHPSLPGGYAEDPRKLMRSRSDDRPTVGLLLMRSYVLARNTGHYDGVIRALESRGLRVLPAFASGLDARPAIEKYFVRDGRACVDAVVSLTGFSLVGGPAYSDPRSAEETLARLDVPYLAAQAVEFQSLEGWESSDAGLTPIEATMMVAIPELDGATAPIVYGGRSDEASEGSVHDMRAHPERVSRLAARVERLVALRRAERADRRVGIVLFNFPPNAGAAGTAMYLAVFESLYNTLVALARDGYTVDVPASVDELREQVLGGNARRHGTDANVHARVPVDRYVDRESHLEEIEAEWGPAPGTHLTDGSSLFVLGARFGNVLVGLQPGSGYEGDPMRLLFEKGLAPTHAFAAFYRYLREEFRADALIHFGTHGALEFMPGKQVGLSAACWPDRLLGDVPNFYLYAANNPSEGVVAKRRSAATLISHLTPPIEEAGLYRGLAELRDSLSRWRSLTPGRRADPEEGGLLARLLVDQASALDLLGDGLEEELLPDLAGLEATIGRIALALGELESTLIPVGLHVLGRSPSREARIGMLSAVAKGMGFESAGDGIAAAIVDGEPVVPILEAAGVEGSPDRLADLARIGAANDLLQGDHEIPSLLRALDGRFIAPAPGGDLIRTLDVLPTGRNLHGFDPFRLPTPMAMEQGRLLARRLLERHEADGHVLPESVALVLWGSDNLKTEGSSIAQALALLGARPRLDSYGRITGAELIPLAELGRPRIDVVVTLSGIFRDLFPIQTRMLAEAALLAANAEESERENFVRKHVLDYVAANGGAIEEAALRVFSNAVGTYGANVNHLVQDDLWSDEDELAETFTRRKSYAYGSDGAARARPELFERILSDVDLAYQNLDSVELGVTSVDIYFDNLGGLSRAIGRASGRRVSVYVGDQTRAGGRVRTLSEQVSLETRTRVLNPKWFEGMLDHGFEGVREIEAHVTNTLGWSATTGHVDPWVYRQIADTFVLDPEMRDRLSTLNPVASTRVVNRLLEAQERNYWTPDPATLEALRLAGSDLEDRVEGIEAGVAAA